MIRGVIFDVDGVLLNSMPVWENLGELYLNRLGIEAEKGLGDTLFTMSLEEGAAYLISHYHLDKTPEEIIKGLNREVQDFYENRVPLKEGARQYLQEFRERQIPMVIATSGDRKNAEAALKRLKVFSYFQGIFTCSEIGSSKSQPDTPRHCRSIRNLLRHGYLKMRFTHFRLRKGRDLRLWEFTTRQATGILPISGTRRISICPSLKILIYSGKERPYNSGHFSSGRPGAPLSAAI